MLNSLSIQNYRNLKDFSIKSLGKLNLITGKNNTGKSSVLEAVALYAAKGNLPLLFDLLGARGFDFRSNDRKLILQAVNSMFSGGDSGRQQNSTISIGPLKTQTDEVGGNGMGEASLTIRYVRYTDEKIEKDGISFTRSRTVSFLEALAEDIIIGTALQIKSNATGNTERFVPLENIARVFQSLRLEKAINLNPIQFIPSRDIDRGTNGELWDEIALTEKEQFVIDALKIIEPATERIAFIGPSGSAGERDAVVKLSGKAAVLPLRGMGDGINRILTIILALVSAEKGFLLIDEFENGLHYSTQEQLWKIIAYLSEKLDVQVFATTHSDDCIRAFEHTINTPGNTLNGKLIRLDNINGNIRQVEFDARELQISTENDIEIR